MYEPNATHDPARTSWIESANDGITDFPIQNLPFGIFVRDGKASGGVAIGDSIFDLAAGIQAGIFTGDALQAAQAAAQPTLNNLMAMEPRMVSALRAALSDHLRSDSPNRAHAAQLASATVVKADQVTLALPCKIEDYTDFLTSIHHTERHGKLKGLKDPLPPAFKYLPVAYHGRGSSIRVSGSEVIRPHGQWKDADGAIRFGVIEAMDFELELGALVARGNPQATPVPIADAAQYLFGFCLLNDWSAKSIQWWEQVLGPFLGKSFHTSLSPWVVTTEALAPFRTAACSRPEGDPQPLPHLFSQFDQQQGAFDISLEAWLSSDAMRRAGSGPSRLTATNVKSLYWTFGQMLAHHTSNGCNLQPGDLLGSGTISGEERSSMACMTEMTNAGKDPITLDNGEQRLWLQDADEVIFKGKAKRDGFVAIGFGECRGRVAAARTWPSPSA